MSNATPETYQQVFGEDLRGIAIREELHRHFGVNPYVAGGLEAQRQTDFKAGGMAVLDFIERKMAQAFARVDPRQDNQED